MDNSEFLYLSITILLILAIAIISVGIYEYLSIRKRRKFRIYLKTDNMIYSYAFNTKIFRGRSIQLDEFLEEALERNPDGGAEKRRLQEVVRRLKDELRKVKIELYRENLINLGCKYDDEEEHINNLAGKIFGNRDKQTSNEWLFVKIEFSNGTQAFSRGWEKRG